MPNIEDFDVNPEEISKLVAEQGTERLIGMGMKGILVRKLSTILYGYSSDNHVPPNYWLLGTLHHATELLFGMAEATRQIQLRAPTMEIAGLQDDEKAFILASLDAMFEATKSWRGAPDA